MTGNDKSYRAVNNWMLRWLFERMASVIVVPFIIAVWQRWSLPSMEGKVGFSGRHDAPWHGNSAGK